MVNFDVQTLHHPRKTQKLLTHWWKTESASNPGYKHLTIIFVTITLCYKFHHADKLHLPLTIRDTGRAHSF